MHEFHRHVLCVGGAGAAPEREQPAAFQKAIRHFLASQSQTPRLSKEESRIKRIAANQGLGG